MGDKKELRIPVRQMVEFLFPEAFPEPSGRRKEQGFIRSSRRKRRMDMRRKCFCATGWS